MVRDAVCRERVSGVIFPVSREFTGKKLVFRSFLPSLVTCVRPFPLASGQNSLLSLTGNAKCITGNALLKTGKFIFSRGNLSVRCEILMFFVVANDAGETEAMAPDGVAEGA